MTFDADRAPLDGISLVEASAGTGKTYAVTTLVLRFIVERHVPLDRIAVMTFTEAATEELRERIRDRVADALAERAPLDDRSLAPVPEATIALRRAEAAIDEAPILTIHGFCRKLLDEWAFESGSTLAGELTGDLDELHDELVHDFLVRTYAAADERTARLLRQAKLNRSRLQQVLRLRLQHPESEWWPKSEPPLAEARPLDADIEALREAWDRDAIERRLTSPALHKNRYRPAQVPRWLDAIEAGFESGVIALETLVRLTPERLAAGTKAGLAPPAHSAFDRASDLCRSLEAEAERGEALVRHAIHGFLDELDDALRTRKRRYQLRSFDDLLHDLDRALAGPHGGWLAQRVRERYRVALVDEFQDTDSVQYRIFRRLYPEGPLILIGDPKQAIYAFRGADVFAYLKARQEVPPARRFTMATNWRSDPSFLRGVGAVYQRHPLPFLFESIHFNPIRPRPGATDALTDNRPEGPIRAGFEVAFVPREEGTGPMTADERDGLVELVVADVRDVLEHGQLGEGAVRPSDVAVLTRTNAQAAELHRSLRVAGIPSLVLGEQSVFSTEVAHQWLSVLRSVSAPTDNGQLRTALTTGLLGVPLAELPDYESDGRFNQWIDRFRQANTSWKKRGIMAAARGLLADGGTMMRLARRRDGDRTLADLFHVIELLHRAERREHRGPAALLAWFERAVREHERAEETLQRIESDADAVRITTIHRSKGLEYPIVFCPHLARPPRTSQLPVFHQPAPPHQLVVDLEPERSAHGQDSAALALRESLAEDLRLLYVALTRAKHRVTVYWGAFYPDSLASALGFLLHPRPMSVEASSTSDVSDADLLVALRPIEAEAEGAFRVRPLVPALAHRPPLRVSASPPPLAPRRLSHPIPRGLRTASFSELASHARGPASGTESPADDGRDRDRIEVVPLPVLTRPEAPLTMADLPRGATFGNFFHDLLENIDFTTDEHRPTIEGQLRRYGFDVHLAPLVDRALGEILATPLLPRPGEGAAQRRRRGWSLSHLARRDRRDELEFVLPVAGGRRPEFTPRGQQLTIFDVAPVDAPAQPLLGPLTAEKLADVFARHPSPMLDPDYAPQLRQLPFEALKGFLKGYIDLVFRHGDRYYLVDYKTNHLGYERSDYEAASLRHAMRHGHYYLQYHLYGVALHRWLQRRIRRYNYGQHFGGVFYLFLRGMHPDFESGIFFERPPESRIDALTRTLDEPPLWPGELPAESPLPLWF